MHNHGAVLQLNALIKVLKRDFGIDAKALQFDKNYDFMGREMKAKYELSLNSIGIYLDYIKDNGLGCFRSKIKGWGNFYVEVVLDGRSVFYSDNKNNDFFDIFFSD